MEIKTVTINIKIANEKWNNANCSSETSTFVKVFKIRRGIEQWKYSLNFFFRKTLLVLKRQNNLYKELKLS